MKFNLVLKVAVSCFTLLALLILAGWYYLEQRGDTHRYLALLETRAKAWIQGTRVDQVPDRLGTTFLEIDVLELDSIPKSGAGGAFASYGKELILLTFDGAFYKVGDEGASQLALEPPKNGRRDLTAMAESGDFPQYNFNPMNLTQPRFHDVLFAASGTGASLLVSYTEWRSEKQCYNTAVASIELPMPLPSLSHLEGRESDWQVIFRSRPCLPLKANNKALEGHMAGGRLAYRPPSYLYLSSGDYHWDSTHHPVALAAQRDNDYGKVIEINLANAQSKRFAHGLRNPQGIIVDSDDRLWTTEHGPRGGDELNLILEGADYGWPSETLGTTPVKTPWPLTNNYGRHDHSNQPIHAWLPSVGASNLTQVSSFHPAWDGDLLVASLVGKSLYRIRLDGDRVVFSERLYIGERIRYVHQHTDGKIYLWTDSHSILALHNPQTYVEDKKLFRLISDIESAGEIPEGSLKEELDRCFGCHSFEADVRSPTAPILEGVYGRKVGRSNYRYYSRSLESHGGKWDEKSLEKFLDDPQAFAPGSHMPDPGIAEDTVKKAIIQVLKQY